jgi:hemoglobin
MKKLLISLTVVAAAGCAMQPASPPPKLKDGEVAIPSDYKSWPKFLTDIQRPDAKQIRDIYINTVGASAKAGSPFANGTMSVMEIYKAKENADGSLMKTADGKLVKGDLAKVFVMAKGEGWGELAPAGLKNGDWSYSAYLADAKTPSPDPIAACRACHLPLGESKDFVHRYDEYFQKRVASGY